MIQKSGPFVLTPTDAAMRWARAAPLVKARNNPQPLFEARPDAWKLWLAMPGQDQQSTDRSPVDAVNAAINSLGGWGKGDPRLVLLICNEWSAQMPNLRVLADWLERAVNYAGALGYGVGGPGWSSGAFHAAEWDFLRRRDWLGLRAIVGHGYFGLPHDAANPASVLTVHNALRHTLYWEPGDPPYIIGEAGRDLVRDGPVTVNDGWVGTKGWRNGGVTDEQYLAEIAAYDAALAKHPGTIGATYFTAGAGAGEWAAYDIDPVSDRIVAATSPVVGGSMVADYPKAEWVPGCTNFGSRSGERVIAIVEHIADGTFEQTKPWFLNPASQSSSTYFVRRSGKVHQFVREADSPWTNGIDRSKGYAAYKSNLAIPWIKRGWETGVDLNDLVVTIEHEGKPADGLTESQYQASRDLNAYLAAKYRIPVDGNHIVGHYQISAVDRANCPGPKFPWGRLFSDLLVAQPPPTYNPLGFRVWLDAHPGSGEPRHDARLFDDGSGDMWIRLTPTTQHPLGLYLIYRKYLHTAMGDLLRAIAPVAWD